MKIEVGNSFRHGFVLTEQELQRIHNLLTEQIQKVSKTTKTTYELKFKNGSITALESLDDLFILDNVGATAIKRLNMTVASNSSSSLYETSLEFRDADFEDKNTSIEYRIKGNNRAWVSVTTSQLEERINRIKRFSINQLIKNKFYYIIFSLTFTVATMIVSFYTIKSRQESLIEPLELIESQWKAGNLRDPIEVILLIEKAQIQAEADLFKVVPFIYLFLVPIPLIIALFIWQYCFPPYNFCWGEYNETFQKRKSLGHFLVVAIFLSILAIVITNGITLLLGVGN
ncbi:MAG: hypothetical protein WA919_19110 [Coleofasciculaceae cyanobacterium]